MRSLVVLLAFVFANAQEDAENANTTNTEKPSCEMGLKAELLVLPPVLLGYDGDDDDITDDETTTTPTTPENSMENFLRKLNKYTLKFEGNLDVPESLRQKLQTVDPRRSEPGGLENLLRLGLVQSMLQSATPNDGYRREWQATPPASIGVVGQNLV